VRSPAFEPDEDKAEARGPEVEPMDEEQLVSKKEVLELAGISYGQLYRWKRKGLIPEAWFIRRSTFTGQETFFPREKILERVARIKDMKDTHPLDDLADVITEQVNAKLQVSLERIRRMKGVDASVLEACDIQAGPKKVLSIQDALCVGAVGRLKPTARAEELDLVQRTLRARVDEALLERITAGRLDLHLLRKRVSGGGISAEISLVVIAPTDAVFDPDVTTIGRVDLQDLLNRIKLDVAARGEEPGSGRPAPEEER
jgi:DNA-binding transcriptional MerR regulator